MALFLRPAGNSKTKLPVGVYPSSFRYDIIVTSITITISITIKNIDIGPDRTTKQIVSTSSDLHQPP